MQIMAHQQSSRLNRLLTLLDTGSTQTTRFTAARQIGDIAKLHSQDLNSLLKKVSQYLHSKNWDTRVAAAHAIGAIAENVKHTTLSEVLARVETKVSEAGISGAIEDVLAWPDLHSQIESGISFRSIDINKVLDFGALFASGGQEYDIATDKTKNPKERLARQKQNLRRRLGLDVCEQFMDVNDMIRDEDLIVHKFNSSGDGTNHNFYTSQPVRNIQQRVANMVPSLKCKRPSARELNLLKRKAKINLKDQIKTWPEDADSEVVSSESVTTPKGSCLEPFSANKVDVNTILDEDNLEHDEEGQWPFHTYVEQLLLDMFDPVWEVRHGSVMALREILTHGGASAGVLNPDMPIEGPLFAGLKSFGRSNSMDGGVEIDLNVQVSLDESEPDLKRPKLEYGTLRSADTMASSSSHGNFILPIIKVEDGGWKSHVGQVNGHVDVTSTKVELEYFETKNSCKEAAAKVESEGPPDDKSTLERINILKTLPENCELMNLVNLSRHSWLRNCEFLQDCAIRFLCVLSLDRFGDYVSDQVVAPVRETCAQALGVVIKYMHPSLVRETLGILLQMQHRSEWEIRHGSLLGIKYLVAVRQEMLQDLFGWILPACKLGLQDPDDDVRAVAADAMIPTAAAIISLKGETLHSIIMLLWDILLDLDDLSPSTSSVMNLLAEIYSHEEMIPKMFGELASKKKEQLDLNEVLCADDPGEGTKSMENLYMLSALSPRLWPFMRHSISSVRYSAIRTLERLLEAGYNRAISEPSAGPFWPSYILGDTLRIVFQNLLLESNEEIVKCSERVWKLLVKCPVEDLESAALSYMSFWIELAVTPYGSPLDASKMFWPVALPRKSHVRAAAKMRSSMLENDPSRNIGLDSANGTSKQEIYGDGPMNSVKIVVGADLDMSITRTRAITGAALGILAAKLREGSLQYVIDPLWKALTSFSGVHRQVASMVLISWFKEIRHIDQSGSCKGMQGHFEPFKKWMMDLLACADPAYPTKDMLTPYAELSRTYAKMRSEASHLFHAVDLSGIFENVMSTTQIDFEVLSADGAIDLASKLSFVGTASTESHTVEDLESLRQRLLTTSGYLKCVQGNLHVSVTSLVAAAIVWMSELPARLNPVILPLMASIKREQEEILQQKAAEGLAELISHCIDRRPSPNDKLIKNLCGLTCMDPLETPQAEVVNSIEIVEDQDLLSYGISSSKQKPKLSVPTGGEDRSRVEGFISRRGSELALKQLCEKFGASLFDRIPKIWDYLTEALKPTRPEQLTPEYQEQMSQAIDSIKDPQILINNIQVVRSITSMLDHTLQLKLLTLLPCIFKCIRHSHVAVRLAASRCITSMAKAMTKRVMQSVLENVIPMLGDMTSIHARHGAGMLFSLLVQGLGVKLVAYATLLVVPLLRCMGDCNPSVRQCVTRTFAALVPLLPLARGLPPPAELSEGLSKDTEDVRFLEQLLDNSHIDDYKLHTELKATLRRYQQEGINWLAFLRRFKLHGILCDDMGLGKTLQASAIVASDIAEQRALSNIKVTPSLIVCPSTLVGHWAFEIEKYIDASVMITLQYAGSAQERISLRDHFAKHTVIITSYDVVRKDIDYLGEIFWNYCILDEGHIIKNSKSKITGAIKQLKSQHRLILSGTPIQNNVLDLWSLFDFLMPGFLGTEKQFQATFGKPLQAARNSKCSAKEAEAGALAMEALHKQVMPFLLRRTKDEVLSDLPEKIIQDRFCDLSPVQLKLYEQFSGSHVRQEISTMVKSNVSANVEGNGASPKASSHVFQALQYLLKLCSHPLLVVGNVSPDSLTNSLSELFPDSSQIISELHKLRHSPKLVALQEILEECGIGLDATTSESTISLGQHRVLIFAQHKAFLDIIEKDLFHTHMKNVTYLRLDGSVETDKRFEIVKSFNSDPTIDVLLLTTHVGGLGLNLTSADTLVFVEHDWNPMRDLQAMDRAHRLGQRKVVNVHRLIMRGTVEEKVMSLQKFKVSVANAVINAENSSMKTMNTDQLLDLFTPSQSIRKVDNALKNSDHSFDEHSKSAGTGKGLKAILGGLEELWDQSQYTEEYNLSQFLSKLNG